MTVMRSTVRRGAFGSVLIVATMFFGVTLRPQASLAQNVASLPTAVRAEGPTVVHDPTYGGVHIEVSSIDVPFSTLSLIVLKVRDWPYPARNKTYGAHAHAKPCAADAAASGPHHANPSGDPTKVLAAREVWLDISIDGLGRGTSIALFDWRIKKGDAGAVVIHADPTNPSTGAAGGRILCTTIPLGS